MKCLPLILTLLVAAACTRNAGSADSASGDATAAPVISSTYADSDVEIMALELPAIPEPISTMEGRAGYLAAHFWDNLNFADTTRSLNANFMEQNFVDFLSLMPAVMSSDRVIAFDNLLDSAAVTRATYWLVIDMGDKYLIHPDSPLRNEEYYIDFVTSALGDSVMTPEERKPYTIYLLNATHSMSEPLTEN